TAVRILRRWSERRDRPRERLVELHDLLTLERRPDRRTRRRIEDDAGGVRGHLAPGVEDPGVAETIDPRAAAAKRRLVYVSGEDQVGPVLGRPAHQLGIPIVLAAGPAHRRVVRRRVIYPNPLPVPPLRIARQLTPDGRTAERPVPPATDGDRDVGDRGLVAV